MLWTLIGWLLMSYLVWDTLEQGEQHDWSDTRELVSTLAVCVIVFVAYQLPIVLIGELL